LDYKEKIMETKKSYEPTYWEHKGKYQTKGEEIWKKLVPASGSCENIHAELYRCISRVYYDVYNNGGCNLESGDYFLAFVTEHVPGKQMKNWMRVIETVESKGENFYMDWENEELQKGLDEVVDAIIEEVYPKLFK
jgi:hypothetical protein